MKKYHLKESEGVESGVLVYHLVELGILFEFGFGLRDNLVAFLVGVVGTKPGDLFVELFNAVGLDIVGENLGLGKDDGDGAGAFLLVDSDFRPVEVEFLDVDTCLDLGLVFEEYLLVAKELPALVGVTDNLLYRILDGAELRGPLDLVLPLVVILLLRTGG